jgi:hypothetical protein
VLAIGVEIRSGHTSRAVEMSHTNQLRRDPMLGIIAAILIVLWLLGMVSAYTMGGFIHLLLVLAIVVILVRVIQGRRPV